jgi:hypothetical protein
MGGMKGVRDAVARIVEAVALPARDRAEIAAPDGLATVAIHSPAGPVAGLTEALYRHFYCVPQPDKMGAGADPSAFLATLRAANPVPARAMDGWTIVQSDAGGILLADANGGRRRAAPAEVIPLQPGLAPGQPVRLSPAREMLTGTAGHYVVLGRPLSDPRHGRQLRFYWNVDADAAAALLAAIGSRLERRRIPFQAKVPADPRGYGRADCGVLYLDGEDAAAAVDLVQSVHASLSSGLRPATPLFARALAPGLAWAEGPPGGESFGMLRCRLIAEGLVQAFDRGARKAEARIGAVLERMRAYGLDLDAVERNPGTHYPYNFDRFGTA